MWVKAGYYANKVNYCPWHLYFCLVCSKSMPARCFSQQRHNDCLTCSWTADRPWWHQPVSLFYVTTLCSLTEDWWLQLNQLYTLFICMNHSSVYVNAWIQTNKHQFLEMCFEGKWTSHHLDANVSHYVTPPKKKKLKKRSAWWSSFDNFCDVKSI